MVSAEYRAGTANVRAQNSPKVTLSPVPPWMPPNWWKLSIGKPAESTPTVTALSPLGVTAALVVEPASTVTCELESGPTGEILAHIDPSLIGTQIEELLGPAVRNATADGAWITASDSSTTG